MCIYIKHHAISLWKHNILAWFRRPIRIEQFGWGRKFNGKWSCSSGSVWWKSENLLEEIHLLCAWITLFFFWKSIRTWNYDFNNIFCVFLSTFWETSCCETLCEKVKKEKKKSAKCIKWSTREVGHGRAQHDDDDDEVVTYLHTHNFENRHCMTVHYDLKSLERTDGENTTMNEWMFEKNKSFTIQQQLLVTLDTTLS